MGVGEKGLSEGEGLDESMRKDCVAPAVIDQSCLLSFTEVTQLLDVEDKFQLKIISACNLNVGKDALVSTSTPPSHTTHPLLTCSLPTLPLASFPGPVGLSLAVRNLRRRPGLVHHIMCAAAYFMTLLLESMMS